MQYPALADPLMSGDFSFSADDIFLLRAAIAVRTDSTVLSVRSARSSVRHGISLRSCIRSNRFGAFASEKVTSGWSRRVSDFVFLSKITITSFFSRDFDGFIISVNSRKSSRVSGRGLTGAQSSIGSGCNALSTRLLCSSSSLLNESIVPSRGDVIAAATCAFNSSTRRISWSIHSGGCLFGFLADISQLILKPEGTLGKLISAEKFSWIFPV